MSERVANITRNVYSLNFKRAKVANLSFVIVCDQNDVNIPC